MFTAQEEMVHAIVVNEGRKRITVMFRGSVTQKDFVQDAKCAQKKIDMPIAALRDDVDGIRIHTGFHGEQANTQNKWRKRYHPIRITLTP